MKTLLLFIGIITCVSSIYGQDRSSEIIDSDSYYVIKRNKLIEKSSTLIQVNNRLGTQNAQIALFYSKGEKLKIRKAQIEDLNGNIIRELNKREIQDESASLHSTLYSDYFVKHFKLIHNTYPYRVRYEYEHEQSKFVNIADINCAYNKMPLKKATITVETPIDYEIKYSQEYIEEPKIEITDDNTKMYTWQYSYDSNIDTDIQTNYNLMPTPRLTVVPVSFKYGVAGGMDNWIDFGNWIFTLNKGRDILPESEKRKVDQLLDGISENYEKIKILYNYMQDNTRYVNISMNIGGLQTYPAEYVCINRYGDCKALTNYMQSLLKYKGIESYYTLINANRAIRDVKEDFASQVFNHVILTVPLSKDTLYLECTSKNIAFGYIPTSIQNRQALLIDENNSHLIRLPKLTVNDVVDEREIEVNNRNVKIYSTLRGYSYELYGFIKDDLNKNEADKFISNHILYQPHTLLEYKFDTKDRNQSKILLSADLEIQNMVKKYGKNAIIQPFYWLLPNYEIPENRKHGLQLDYPTHRVDKIIYNLSNINFEKTPKDILIETDFGTYSIKYTQIEGKLVVYKSLIVKSGRYTLDQYPDFYKFITNVKYNEQKNIILELL